jgi:energy-coupling factor transporter ATP-binding protein EcfA2
VKNNLNWNNIRSINGDQREGFEEFVTQLARMEIVQESKHFIRKGTPDAGVECYWILEDNTEWAWQAKYFTSSLESSQWKQIDESVQTAIEKHPNMVRYFIAIPINPSDGRQPDQKSLLDKWDEHVKKWQIKAQENNKNIQFTSWWSSDLISRLQSREMMGFLQFWFNKDFLSDEWFNRHIEKAVADLQQRYTPELNYRMPIVKIFDGIAKDNKFVLQVFDELNILLTEINDLSLNDKIDNYNYSINEIKNNAKLLEKEYYTIRELGFENFNFNNMSEMCLNIRTNLSNINKLLDVKNEMHNNLRYELSKVSSFLSDFQTFLESTTIQLFNLPYLLICGKAGAGKSHLLGDMATLRKDEGKYSLLLLGQQLNSNDSPEVQILKNLGITCTFEEFLVALSCRAQIQGSRLIIFIDAINEGNGKEFWPGFFNGFLESISKYPCLGIVFTIRDSYIDIIKNNLEAAGNKLVKYQYNGFTHDGYKVIKRFFSYFGLEQPSNPILYPEFKNPLFLMLFCKSLKARGLKRIPDGFQGISELIEIYIDNINKLLCKQEKFNYSKSMNLVYISVNAIIAYFIDNKTRRINIEKAIEIVETALPSTLKTNGKYLEELISEGLFSKNLMREENKNVEFIYFTYERFADHLIVKYLFDTSQDIEKKFIKGDKINLLFYNANGYLYTNYGLLEAFAIQFPERTSKEVYECLDIKKFPEIIEIFLESLKWRKLDTINDKCNEFINNNIIHNDEYFEQFFDFLISVSTIEKHYFNAYYLHKYLMNFSMSDRDAFWSYYLKYKYSEEEDPVRRLIDWAWNDDSKDHISNESIKLASIAMAWFLSSTKREIRDSATKALISILENRLTVLIDVLKHFEKVDDPYIYERLFAVAYGCTLRTKQKDVIIILAEYIFKTIFDKNGEIYPHILLRDYACNIIAFANFLNFSLSFDISKTRPPYKSYLKIEDISNEEIDEKYKSKDDNKKSGQDEILQSMATEYSRGMCGYGDFGRYIFEYKFDCFPIEPRILSNMAVKLIFDKYGYTEEKHGNYEKSISYDGRQPRSIERIGKKYQWIAMHELLARVTDNIKRQSKYEYDMEGNIPYQGSWEPFVRDIDPTVLIKKEGYLKKDEANYKYWWENDFKFNFCCSEDEWLSNVDELKVFKDIFRSKDGENNNWLKIQAYPQWSEPQKIGEKGWGSAKKEIWIHLRSYFCKKNSLQKIIKHLKKLNFSGRWMPENIDKYVLFFRERYWAPSYQYCVENDYDGNQLDLWEDIIDRTNKNKIGSIIIPTEEYTWEKDTDFSIDESLRLIVPSKFVFNGLKMNYGDEEGEYLDIKRNLICYNPSIKYDTKQHLLIREESLLKFLQENDLEIFWTILGEKQILGGDISYHGRLDFSCIYHLKSDGTFEGSMNTFRLPGSDWR